MRLLVHLAKRDLVGTVVGYTPGRGGKPLAIILANGNLVSADLSEIEVLGVERRRKFKPTALAQAEADAMDKLN